MHIYRVAHRTIENRGMPAGPYSSRWELLPSGTLDRLSHMYDAHSDMRRHPDPFRDSELQEIYRSERCGFDSLDSLYAWFDGYTEELHESGFCIYVYEVPSGWVRVGNFGQSLFDENFASLSHTITLTRALVEV